MDITVGRVAEAADGSGVAAPPGAVVGLVVSVRSSRHKAGAVPSGARERRGSEGRPDPARSVILTVLVDDAAAIPFKIVAGTTHVVVRLTPRGRG